MSQTRLFEVGKVGCFCDAITHAIEKRRESEVKVLTLTLRVAPFDGKLATAMPDGVKSTLFKATTGDPKDTLDRVNFRLGLERQRLTVYAAPDTDAAAILFDQARVHGIYARTEKDRNGYVLVFRVTFGPVGRDELEACQAWLLSQKFVTFEQAEPGMVFEDEPATDETKDADDVAQRTDAPPAPMWDDDDPPAAAAEAPEPARRLPRRNAKKGPAETVDETDEPATVQ